ncbi:MAG: glucose-1-phosphate adenylyltransferase [Acidobacteriota bacterium]|nr:MAG: glucose-1-phosphate adenylyltransferase [Acidobacteriota bacterium]
MHRELDRLSTFILAGGRGERLYPLTKDRAKPAVVFGGNYRIIDFTLSNCVNSEIRRVNVLTQYKSMSLAKHIKLGWNIYGSELREYIDALPAQQRYGAIWYRGTADAIYQNIYTIERENRDYVLILAGDHIYKMDYSRMLWSHIEREAEVTVGVVEMPLNQCHNFGVLQVDTEQRIVNFQEKPATTEGIPGRPDLICASMGIYIFNKEALFEELIPGVESEGRHDFGTGIIPRMLGRRRLFAYSFIDENRKQFPYWRDIGTLDAFYEANMDLVDVDPLFNLYDTQWPVRTLQMHHPPAKTVFRDPGDSGRRGEALDSLICSGCIVSGGMVVRSILSPLVRINSFARVEESVLMDGVNVGRHAQIRRAIIDKFVDIEPGTQIGYDLESDRRRFTVTEKGVVVIPARCLVGPNRLKPLWEDPVVRYRTQIRSND